MDEEITGLQECQFLSRPNLPTQISLLPLPPVHRTTQEEEQELESDLD